MFLDLPDPDPDPLVSGMDPDPEPDPELDPDALVRGTDPGIRIRTKMSRIPNTGVLFPQKNLTFFFFIFNT
jgi:hypothetical protein